ncbi:MAG TPA: hypothetical protein VHA30_04655 [Patescibacteria group bacterium]|nr:hypothetical protein [Patescibacteria group bacterium]
MPNNPVKPGESRQYRTFWPAFIIVIVGLVAAGVVYYFAYGNMLQDDIDSDTFWTYLVHPQPHAQKAPLAAPTASATPVFGQ